MDACNVVRLHNMRQRKDDFQYTFQRRMQVTSNLVKRLSLESELEGHSGCVNCLQWNEAGDLLASGSDDLNIILWAPFLVKKYQIIQSGHNGNIFSVKFLPGTNDRYVVSGAADFKIRVNDITRSELTFSCCCHGGRVKRIATAANLSHMFWSAAEDGMILQFDLRTPHHCTNVCTNVLVNLVNHLGRTAEAKCIAVNPVNTDLIAVGANDPYIRLYDRRMIKPTTARFAGDRSFPWDFSFTGEPVEPGNDNLSPECVNYFVAGHLPLKQNDFKRRYRSLTATYVTFSPDGKDLLANLGGEQIYLFNIQSKRNQMVFNMSEKALNLNTSSREDENQTLDCCQETFATGSVTNGLNGVSRHSENCLHYNTTYISPEIHSKLMEKCALRCLPQEVNDMKSSANLAFERQDFNLAIALYSSAIVLYPAVACLYGNRAAAYMKRGWDGDFYAAVRDCRSALDLDSNYLKAHFRLAQCLHKLRWAKEAYDCLQAFKIRFPQYTTTKSFEVFENDVKMGIFAEVSLPSQSSATSNASQGASSSHAVTEAEADKDKKRDGNNSSVIISGTLPRPLITTPTGISDEEKSWRASAYDYEHRFCGHCNTTTDIKEANFFGSYGEYVIAGSDDGSIFIWDRVTANIARILRGDDSIVNCLQPHPSTCVLATSGIDPVVRIWSPRAEDGSKDEREVLDKDDAAFANQRRMNADPLEIMLLNMGYRLPSVLEQMTEDIEGGPDRNSIHCRTS